ncbi:TolC family protein [Erwinia sp. E_sp_B01_3]|uniref:TolC family protein n=1 Tax=Erwinia sp. E_sp_B01_3 TaxID=3039402 RepID=UPI0030CEDD5A
MDIWGKKLSEIDSLSEESKGDQSLVAALQLTLMSDLANTWYETLSMIKIWHMLTGKIVMLDDIHTRLKGVNEMERLDPLLLSKFMRGKTSDVTNQQNLQKEILNRIHKLEYLSGYRSPWLNEESWKNLSGDYAIQTVPQSIQSDVIFNRPDVIAAEAKIKAANGTIGMARAAFLPVFNLFANAYHTSDSFDRVLGNLTDNWTLTPSVIIPIFRWPKNYANLNYAHSQQALAVVAYRKIVAQGLLDIQDSTNNLRASEETTATLMDEVDIHRQNLSKLTTRYEAGYGDLYNLYEAIDLLTSSQFDLESHRQQVMTNTIVLLKAIGG